MIQISTRQEESLSLKKSFVAMASLILGSHLTIFLYPVPITLQTFVVYLMALFCSPKEAFLAVLGFLAIGFSGFPAFAPMAFYTVGYLFGMLFGSAIAAHMVKRKCGFIASLFVCYVVVHLFGCGYLAMHLGFAKAITAGLVPFIVPEILKITTAISIKSMFSKKTY